MSTPIFPEDPANQPEYINTATNLKYLWNDTTQAWRLEGGGSGGSSDLIPDPNYGDHQPGTLDSRYVEISGDTMTGPLIQHLGDDDL